MINFFRNRHFYFLVTIMVMMSMFTPAMAQVDQFRGIYGEIFNREYRDTPEGRQKLVNDIKTITLERGLLKYFPEFGMTISTLQEFTALSDRYPVFEALSDKVGKFGSYMSYAGIIFDLASGTRKDAVVVKSYLISMGSILGKAGFGGVGVAMSLAQYFMEYAGNAVYDTYEQRWYNVYRHYYTLGDGKLSYPQWTDRLEQNTYKDHMNRFWELDLMELLKEYEDRDIAGFARDGLVFSDKTYKEKFMARFFAEEIKDTVSNILRVRGEQRAREAEQNAINEFNAIKAEMERISRMGTLVLNVSESETGLPVEGASVKLILGDQKKIERNGVTDAKGVATLQIPPVSEMTIQVDHRDYNSQTNNVGRFEITMDGKNPRPMTAGVFLAREKVGFVVRVKNAKDGSSLDGAAVSVKTGNFSTDMVTSGGGQASLQVYPGKAQVSVSLADYKPQSFSMDIPSSGADRTVELQPLAYGGLLTVNVKNAKTGEPLSGITVAAAAGSRKESQATREGRAEISFDDVNKGSPFTISLSGKGFKTATGSGVFGAADGSSQLTASATLEMEPESAFLEVFIKDKGTDKPLSGVKVAVQGVKEHVLTGEDGKARIEIPNQEQISITVSKDGYANASGNREVRDGIAKASIYLQKSEARLSVRVGDKSNNRPLGGVAVKAVVAGVETRGTTGDEGIVNLSIPDGKSVDITLWKKGYDKVEFTKPIVNGNVSAGGTLTPVKAVLSITIKDKETQKPVRGVSVKAGTESGATNENGICILSVPPSVELEIKASAQGYQHRSATGKTPGAGETREIGWYLEPVKPAPVQPQQNNAPAVKPDPRYSLDGSYNAKIYHTQDFQATGTISFSINKGVLQGSFNGKRALYYKGDMVESFSGTFSGDASGRTPNIGAISIPIAGGSRWRSKDWNNEGYNLKLTHGTILIYFRGNGKIDGQITSDFGAFHFKNHTDTK